MYSINYERIVLNRSKYKTAIQFGVSAWVQTEHFTPLWLIDMTEIMSFSNHHAELGIGTSSYYATPSTEEHGFWINHVFLRLGYRYQKPSGRFLFRAGFTPAIHHMNDLSFEPWGGLTVGLSRLENGIYTIIRCKFGIQLR